MDEKTIREAKAALEGGMGLVETAAILGVNKHKLRRELIRAGWRGRHHKPIDIERAKKLYDAGLGCIRIAKILGKVSSHAVLERLVEAGVTIRARNGDPPKPGAAPVIHGGKRRTLKLAKKAAPKVRVTTPAARKIEPAAVAKALGAGAAEVSEARDFLDELRERGITFTLENDRLFLHGPKGFVTPETRTLLLRHRDALKALLAAELKPAIVVAPPAPVTLGINLPEALALYDKGWSCYELSARYEVSRDAVRHAFDKAGVVRRQKSDNTTILRTALKALLAEGAVTVDAGGRYSLAEGAAS